MRSPRRTLSRAAAVGLLAAITSCSERAMEPPAGGPEIPLPSPRTHGGGSLDDALAHRRSVRTFAPTKLSPDEIGQLLWAAQGITDPSLGHRTAPSAGALYPLELYVVADDGAARYVPRGHAIQRIAEGDLRSKLADAALDQDAVREAPAAIVVTAVPERTARKYGSRAERYVALEAGHAAENVLLEATALGLGAVPIGAFDDEDVRSVLRLPPDEQPLYILPVGHPR